MITSCGTIEWIEQEEIKADTDKVIGGGNAGNTIAARLALAGESVAVLEAGGFYETLNGNRTQVPGYNWQAVPSVFSGGMFTSLVGYDLVSTPQPVRF